MRNAVALACLLLLPIAAIAQLPSPTYGWNLGNTLDATWTGATPPTQAMINAVKAAGFNTIRIPCAWDHNADPNTHQISSSFMSTVTQTVQWAQSAGLTVVINDHWDGGWFEDCGFASFDSNVNAKLVSYWTQIANNFKNYNSGVLFACANEPNVTSQAQTNVLFQYYQSFVNTVRNTGGNNATRYLIIQGPGGGNIDNTNSWVTSLPSDSAGAGHLVFEVHYYAPYQYSLMTADASWGSMWYFWGSGYHSSTLTSRNATSAWEESYVTSQLQLMYNKFSSKGVPVLIGEFGAIRRNTTLSGNDLNLHLASRTYFDEYFVAKANSLGCRPCYWDDGDSGNGNNSFGIFNRSTAQLTRPDDARALTGGSALPPPGGATLTVSSSTLSAGATAGTQTVSISSNISWTVSASQSWITVSPVSGSGNATLSVSVTQNTGASRSGSVTVAGGGLTRTISVTQAAGSTGGGTSGAIQAESGVAGGGVTFDTSNAGYNGTGFANFPTSGGTLTFNNVSSTGGSSQLAIRYANGSGASRTGLLVVNGTSTNITFPATTSWTAWTTLNVNITLNSGTANTIAFQSNGQDLANIDEFTITALSTPDVYQAENAALAGGAFTETTNAGYNGTGYTNFPTSGGTCTFNNVDGNGGGVKAIAIRYANGGTTGRTGTLTVNGTTTNITFNPTGSWTTWSTLTVNVTLNNNTTNSIQLASTGQDLGNIDQLTVP
jgi:aryl-phospho-beta-D-glucosidase BglC (GH1 family)